MEGTTTVRPATAADLPRISAIYAEQVAHGISTFDVEPPPLAHWEQKLASTARGDHLLVASLEDPDGATDPEAVVGAAYSGVYRPRPAYDRTREVSVYLDPSARGLGVGRALYADLLARLRADGVHTVLAVIAQPNPASEALHRSFGFTRVGLLPQVGRKFDRWIDTAFWALVLEEG